MIQKYIKIKDIEIPINIKNYKNSKSIKMYFKANVLNITKPTRLSDKRMMGILKLEEDELYNKYKKIMSSEVKSVKQWENEEKIFYKGKEFDIVREYTKNLEINVIQNIQSGENRTSNPYSMTIYFAKPGDSLWKIAKKFRSTVDNIAKVNGIEDVDKIEVGQQLFIPRYNG